MKPNAKTNRRNAIFAALSIGGHNRYGCIPIHTGH
jgi:hypothetical protein